MSSLVLVALAVVAVDPYDGWQPHAYCNDLDLMDATRIEPLTVEQQGRVEALQQVQIVARHGARAPYYRVFCWDHKENNPMNAEWDCTTSSVSSQDIGFKQPNGVGRLYGKAYLHGQNILSGTCTVGGLLPLGRQQHLKNGQLLQDAYIGKGPFKLFEHSNLSQLPIDQIFLRSDDQERTLGSGHALLDGLFPPEESTSSSVAKMPLWHVVDYAADHVNTNDAICPIMGVLSNASTFSTDFQKHINDPQTIQLEKDVQQHVGNFTWNTILECLSIARCNNLPLPDGFNEQLFTRAFNEVQTRQGIFLTHNDSRYAKMAMQPLMKEIVTRLDAALAGKTDAPRLAITMGHDSTIMPLMASLLRENWDRLWTPYAGVFIFELYRTKSSSHAMRVLFKGQPLRLPECADTLCDIEDFLKAVEFSRTDRQCALPVQESTSADLSTASNTPPAWSKYLSAGILLGLTALCALLGFQSHRQRMKHQAKPERRALLP